MIVYSLEAGPRLKYILDFIGNEIFSGPIQLTTGHKEFVNYNGPKINYSKNPISKNEYWIYNVDLLFESSIKKQAINCFECDGHKAFFKINNGDYQFDIFAAAFYLLSRYEEYLPHIKDKYGRYAHVNSLAYNESFLHLPLINIWLSNFKKALLNKFPDLKFRSCIFTFQPTYDIDIAWSYRNKGWWRNAAGLLKSALGVNFYAIRERLNVLFRNYHDPFDSYKWLHDIHKRFGLDPVYFFLIAIRQRGFDKNISPEKEDLQALISEHDALYETGIHPSWQSGDDDRLLEQEVKKLEQLTGHEISYSRQHYLRFTLPTTFQKLVTLGISKEYSMGYGTVNGFRASVASSFYWYDLSKDASTSLLLYPFCFMDANAYYELKVRPEEALVELVNFYKSVKEVDGLMITLWHNNFLGTDRSFAGWREVYERFLKMLHPVVEPEP